MNIINNIVTSSIIKRYEENPVLSAKDMPYEASLIYNAGVTKFNGKYVMAFRNDTYDATRKRKDIKIGIAFSNDGIKWKVEPKTIFDLKDNEIISVYDPRLTVIARRCYMCFAIDTYSGLRGGIAVTDDFSHFEVLTMTAPDNRNMVLFPELINGHYYRLERPMPTYGSAWLNPPPTDDIWISNSPNMVHWGNTKKLLSTKEIPFANLKCGPASPPIKTEKGWLTLFHAVDDDPSRGKNGWEDKWTRRYTTGVMLLDLNDPTKIIGVSKKPLIVPEADYEKEGMRGNVVFPGGMILEDDGEVKIYYGAADSVECLATAHIDDLLKFCL